MKIENILNQIFITAYNEAKLEKHEYFTPEHVLYSSLFFDEGKEMIENCGGNIEELKEQLTNYFKQNISVVEEGNPIETNGMYNVLKSTERLALSCGRDYIKLADFIIALYDEEDSFGSYFIQSQGIDRLDILKYISHGVSSSSDDLEMVDEDDENQESEQEHETKNKEKNMLANFTIELTEKARKGKIDPVIGREDIIERTIQTLSRRTKNNPIHVGDPGVGKTAITEGLARLIVENKVPKSLLNTKIYYLDMGALVAGTKYRGDFEERIKKVLNEIGKEEKPIVYIDEIHTVVGAGSVSGGAMDASNILKPFLMEGNIRFIGSTTYEEYKKYFEKDRALTRRFQKIEVLEPSIEDAYKILQGLKSNYEEFHGVKYTDLALHQAVELSSKYINDRFLPDKAIDLIDEAGAYMRLHASSDEEVITIDGKDIEKIISTMAKIPEQSVSTNEVEQLKALDTSLKNQIFGQDEAINIVVRAIKRSRAGFNEEDKPVVNLLFVGPTGVGKTEICKQLSKVLGVPLVRFDMSEYQEKHTVARLIGAPPGYVGYEEGGLLTEAIRKTPHCVLLLDEIEKVHPDILNVLLQLMDYATLTDNTGRKTDFKNVILIMTSNAGARSVGKTMIGFGERRLQKEEINKEVERVFSPEFRNRLDDTVIFNDMNEDMALLVAKKAIRQFEEKLSSKNIKIQVTDNCYKWIVTKALASTYGAREIIRIVNQEVKPYFIDEVLFGELSKGGVAEVDIVGDKISIKSV